ncbi:SCO family protein [Actinomadura kijaniata]|uniref:SCO family protein n=1 Tax=Actinomadura kijaniata TaxID=46161 RepID=UPI003F1E093A
MRTSVRSLLSGLGLAGALAATAACGGGQRPAVEAAAPASPYKATRLPASYKIPQVTLTGTDGKPHDLAERARGKVTLLFFGFTHCPDICPTTMADAAGAMSLLSPRERARTQVVFVTADPRRDGPAVLKDFLGRFDPSFVGLTGPVKEIRRAAADAKVPITPPPADARGNYQVSHGSNVMVYGPDGSGRLMFPYQFGSADMARDLRTLLAREDAAAPGRTGIAVTGARVRVPSTPDVTAGYLTLTNDGAPDSLTGVSSPAAGSVEMHRMEMGHGSMRMEQVKTVPVPRGTVRFEKGGLHLMLMRPRGVEQGRTVPLVLRFAKAGEIRVEATVVPAGS